MNRSVKHFCSKECMYESYRWKERDIDILKYSYGKIKIEEIQSLLSEKRTKSAIKDKARVLGLSKNRLWSNEEENILFKNYDKLPLMKVSELLPNRSIASIMGKVRTNGLKSYFYLNNVYSKDEIQYITENYLSKNNEELANHIRRSPHGVEQKLRNLGLFRPYEIKKDGYMKLNNFIRARLALWKNEIREKNNYTCCLTGLRSNIIVHHCRSFNLLMQENIDNLNFEIKDCFSEYTDNELIKFLQSFLNLQAYYGEYVCITEKAHVLFHKEFGYGDNTIEQWNIFVNKFKAGYYKEVA